MIMIAGSWSGDRIQKQLADSWSAPHKTPRTLFESVLYPFLTMMIMMIMIILDHDPVIGLKTTGWFLISTPQNPQNAIWIGSVPVFDHDDHDDHDHRWIMIRWSDSKTNGWFLVSTPQNPQNAIWISSVSVFDHDDHDDHDHHWIMMITVITIWSEMNSNTSIHDHWFWKPCWTRFDPRNQKNQSKFNLGRDKFNLPQPKFNLPSHARQPIRLEQTN